MHFYIHTYTNYPHLCIALLLLPASTLVTSYYDHHTHPHLLGQTPPALITEHCLDNFERIMNIHVGLRQLISCFSIDLGPTYQVPPKRPYLSVDSECHYCCCENCSLDIGGSCIGGF